MICVDLCIFLTTTRVKTYLREGRVEKELVRLLRGAHQSLHYCGGAGLITDSKRWRKELQKKLETSDFMVKRLIDLKSASELKEIVRPEDQSPHDDPHTSHTKQEDFVKEYGIWLGRQAKRLFPQYSNYMYDFEGAPVWRYAVHYIVFDRRHVAIVFPSRGMRKNAIILHECPDEASALVDSLESLIALLGKTPETPTDVRGKMVSGTVDSDKERESAANHRPSIRERLQIAITGCRDHIQAFWRNTREEHWKRVRHYARAHTKQVVLLVLLLFLLIAFRGQVSAAFQWSFAESLSLFWQPGWKLWDGKTALATSIILFLASFVWLMCLSQQRHRVELLDREEKFVAGAIDLLKNANNSLYYYGGIGLIGDYDGWKRELQTKLMTREFLIKRLIDLRSVDAFHKMLSHVKEEERKEMVDNYRAWRETHAQYARAELNNFFYHFEGAPIWKFAIHCVVFDSRTIAIVYPSRGMYKNAIFIHGNEKAAKALVESIESMISYLRKSPEKPDEIRSDSTSTGKLLEDHHEAPDALNNRDETLVRKLLQECDEARKTFLKSSEAMISFLNNIPSFGNKTDTNLTEKLPSTRSRRRGSRTSENSADKIENDGTKKD